jgi:hypothetical protein
MSKDFAYPRFLLSLASLAALILLLAYQVSLPQRVDLGAPGDAPFLRGFYFAESQGETSFRWSGPTGQVAFVGAGGRPWRLRVHANAMHPDSPAVVKVTVNGRPVAEEIWGGDLAEHAFVLTLDQIGLSGDVQMELGASTFVAPPDERQLGIMVDWVELQPVGWSPTVPSWIILGGGLIVVLLAGSAAQKATYSTRWAWAAGLLAAAGFAAVIVTTRLQISLYLPWLILGMALAWLFAGRVRHATWREYLLFVLLVWSAVRFCARALAFWRDGLPPGDFTIYFNAADNLRIGAPLYDFVAGASIPNGPVYKYPPLFAMLLAPLTPLPVHDVAAGWYLLNLGLLAVIGYMVVRVARSDQGTPVTAGYLVAILFLNFQPGWESLIRGQLDIVILAGFTGALWLLQARRAEWLAGVLLGLVTMLKLYPGLLAVYLLCQRRWGALGGLAGAALALLLLSGMTVGWDTLWRYGSEILVVQAAAVPWPENQSLDGFLSRLIIPAADTTWYTTVPFPPWARWTLYAVDVALFAITLGLVWLLPRPTARRFRLGFAAAMPLVVLLWPTAWIHYGTLLVLPFALLAIEQLEPDYRSWGLIAGLFASYLLVAVGNEYTVLIPALQEGWPRLLQSYKMFGVLILWILLLWAGSRPVKRTFRHEGEFLREAQQVLQDKGLL